MLQILSDDEIFADPQQWLLDAVGREEYRNFKNLWPQISSRTKVEIKTSNNYRWTVADCKYSAKLDTLFIYR